MAGNIRKILSKEELERKSGRNKKIIVIVIGIILVLSTAGYLFTELTGTKTKPLVFNGIKFAKTEYGSWSFAYGGNNYETAFNPSDTANISGKITKRMSDYYGALLYLSAQPIEDFSQAASQEILRNIGSLISRSNPACLDENCSQDYPPKNCSGDNIIVFKESKTNSSSLSENNKCVILEYSPGEEEMVADAFLFRIMDIEK